MLKNITLLVVVSVTLGESTKIGFGNTIKQMFNFNCMFVYLIHLIVKITICKTKNKDCDKVCLNLNHMIQQHEWSACTRPYAYTHTVRPYEYTYTVRTVRVRSKYSYGLEHIH